MKEYLPLVSNYIISLDGSLPEAQKHRLGTILKGFNPKNETQRVLFSAGYRTIERALETNEFLYAGIRGSVSYGRGNEKDDVDILLFCKGSEKDMRELKRYIGEIARKNGEKAKKCLPYLERPESGIVTFCLFGGNDYEKFKNEPWLLDMENIDFQTNKKYIEAMKIISTFSKYMEQERILFDLYKDPFEFLEKMLGVFVRVPKYKEKLWRKVFDHYKSSIVLTRARLGGIQIKGDVPQHELTKARDKFIENYLLPNAYVLDF